MKKVFIILSIIALSWVLGVFSQIYKFFPYKPLQYIYNKLYYEDHIRAGPLNLDYHVYSSEMLAEEKRKALSYYDYISNNSGAIRKELLNSYVVPSSVVEISKLNKEEEISFKKKNILPNDVSIFKSVMYGLNHYGVFEASRIAQGKKKLLIYIGGHGQNPYNNEYGYDYFEQIKTKFKKKEFDILVLTLTGVGFNEEKAAFPTKIGKVIYGIDAVSDHRIYAHFVDNRFPKLKPLSMMLSGNYHLIRSLLDSENGLTEGGEKYDEVYMLGISGGGWSTVMLSSLIPDIQKSFSFSGSLPLNFRIAHTSNYGEWEDIDASIWKNFDYWHFYFLSLFDKTNTQNREQHLIFNDKDECCYSGNAALSFKSVVDSINIKGLKATIVKNNKHTIDISFVNNVILRN